MVHAITWWLTVELLGFLALPITLTLFRNLPDRGYILSKALGILALSYGIWLTGSAHLLPNTRASLLVVALVIVGAAILVMRGRSNDMLRFLRENLKVVLCAELVFALVFAGAALVRAYNPEIYFSEKAADFAFLNACLRSEYFPPHDPWLSGYQVSYYYFGHLMMATLTRLTAVPPSVAYNLAVALVFALAGAGAFSLVYNLVQRGKDATRRTASLTMGMVGLLFLVVLSNLEGVLELAAWYGMGTAEFWQWIGIDGLGLPYQEYFWWWRGSRVISTVVGGQFLDRTINEFPFFSFLLGDLHPHYMALPFGLLALALSLNFLWEPGRLGLAWARENALMVGLSALCLGGLVFLNTWDFPTYSFVLLVALGIQASRVKGGRAWVGVACLTLFASLFLYLPFYLTFQSQASGILPMRTVGTRHLHYIIFWGVFIFIILSFVFAKLGETLRRKPVAGRTVLWAVLTPLVPYLVWGLLEIALSAMGGRAGEGPAALLAKFLGLLPLLSLLAITLFIALREVERDDQSSALFALVLAFTGLLLTMGVELFYIEDLFRNRMNTVFKLYYQAWAMLAIASAFGVHWVGSKWGEGGRWRRGLGAIWWLALALLVGGALLYPVGGIHTKARYYVGGSPTLDGMTFMRQIAPSDHGAIEWLNSHVEGTPIILEAWGPDFTLFGRVSAYTGLPTLLGWSAHEWQWRGSRQVIEEREKDVDLIYQSRDAAETRALLDKYAVTFVYVGRLERAKYGQEGLGKFDSFMDVVFKNSDVAIYRMRDRQ